MGFISASKYALGLLWKYKRYLVFGARVSLFNILPYSIPLFLLQSQTISILSFVSVPFYLQIPIVLFQNMAYESLIKFGVKLMY